MGTEGALTHRVVRVCLDDAALTPYQRTLLDRHAGTARAVWNWALAARNAQQDALMAHVRAVAIEQAAGDETAAATLLDDRTWRTATIKAAPDELRRPLRATTLGRAFTAETRDPDSRFAWWAAERHGVNRFAVSSSLQALDAAFDRYYRDTGGHRSARRARPRKDGRPAAWPRFKKRGRATDAFALFNLVVAGQDPWRVIDGAHRIKVPSLGSLRVHENTKRLRARGEVRPEPRDPRRRVRRVPTPAQLQDPDVRGTTPRGRAVRADLEDLLDLRRCESQAAPGRADLPVRALRPGH